MDRMKSQLLLAVVFLFGILIVPGDVFAEVGEVGSEWAEKAGATVDELARKFADSIAQGDFETAAGLGGSLAIRYVMPAACALLFLFACYLVASFVARRIGQIVSKKIDLTLGRFLTKAIKTSVMVLGFLAVLTQFGVNVTSFAALLAAVGFAVGMALQGTLSNFAAGIMLMVFRPFKVDDYVVVDGVQGVVEEIDLFTTRVNTLDNRHIIVPNGQIFGNTIQNFSRNEFRRVDILVGTAYEADMDKTRLALINAGKNIPGMVVNPAPQVAMVGLGASSVDWEVRVWCRPADYWTVHEILMDRVKRALDQANISIPYPQMDVHVAGRILSKAAA